MGGVDNAPSGAVTINPFAVIIDSIGWVPHATTRNRKGTHAIAPDRMGSPQIRCREQT